MAFVIGDYEYTVYSSTNRTVSAKVVDTTKTAYADIPQTVTNDGTEYTVTRLGSCFKDCANMVNPPTIPSTVTYMNRCFDGCSSMVNPPAIPSGVTTMRACFFKCSSLIAAPHLPNGADVSYYAAAGGCFEGCSSLISAPNIPSGNTDIRRMFYGCSSLVNAPDIPSGVTTLDYCFEGCESLIRAPEIPSGVESMKGCFRECTSLEEMPTIPSGVTDLSWCFGYCNFTEAKPIPSGVTDMAACFYSCKKLKTAPTIPDSVTNLSQISGSNRLGCFQICTSLESAPRIPSNVTYVSRCFKGCNSLSGSVIVTNTPTAYDEIFAKTRNPIYVVPMGSADQTVWKAIADQYANVIFMADANSKPALAFTVTRVSASGATAEDVEGGWAHVVASATAYMDALPDGYTNDVGALTATLNGTAITPTWTQVSKITEDYKVTLVRETWVQITDARQLFAIYVEDSYSARSAVITVKLPSTGVMWDVHAGGDGFTIGRRATGPGFAVAMDSDFEGDVDVGGALSFDGEQAYPLFVSTTVPTGSSAYGLTACFVYCTADGGLYYCT